MPLTSTPSTCGPSGWVSLPWPLTPEVEMRERARIVFVLNCIVYDFFDFFVLIVCFDFVWFFGFDFICLFGFDLIVLILVV